MKRRLVGSWLALVCLGACDDTDDAKRNCRAVADKYDECAPKIINKAIESLPENMRGAVEAQKDEQLAKVKARAAELRAQCDAGGFSDAEKQKFRSWRRCLEKDCGELSDCIAE